MLFCNDDKNWVQRLDCFCRDLNKTFLMNVRFTLSLRIVFSRVFSLISNYLNEVKFYNHLEQRSKVYNQGDMMFQYHPYFLFEFCALLLFYGSTSFVESISF